MSLTFPQPTAFPSPTGAFPVPQQFPQPGNGTPQFGVNPYSTTGQNMYLSNAFSGNTAQLMQSRAAQQQQLMQAAQFQATNSLLGNPMDSNPTGWTPEQAQQQTDRALAKLSTVNPELANQLAAQRTGQPADGGGFWNDLKHVAGEILHPAVAVFGKALDIVGRTAAIVPNVAFDVVNKGDFNLGEDVGGALAGTMRHNWNSVFQEAGIKGDGLLGFVRATVGLGFDALTDPLTYIIPAGAGMKLEEAAVQGAREAGIGAIKKVVAEQGAAGLEKMGLGDIAKYVGTQTDEEFTRMLETHWDDLSGKMKDAGMNAGQKLGGDEAERAAAVAAKVHEAGLTELQARMWEVGDRTAMLIRNRGLRTAIRTDMMLSDGLKVSARDVKGILENVIKEGRMGGGEATKAAMGIASNKAEAEVIAAAAKKGEKALPEAIAAARKEAAKAVQEQAWKMSRAMASVAGGARIKVIVPFTQFRYISSPLFSMSRVMPHAAGQVLTRFFAGQSGTVNMVKYIGEHPEEADALWGMWHKWTEQGWSKVLEDPAYREAAQTIRGRGKNFGSMLYSLSEKVGGLTTMFDSGARSSRAGLAQTFIHRGLMEAENYKAGLTRGIVGAEDRSLARDFEDDFGISLDPKKNTASAEVSWSAANYQHYFPPGLDTSDPAAVEAFYRAGHPEMGVLEQQAEEAARGDVAMLRDRPSAGPSAEDAFGQAEAEALARHQKNLQHSLDIAQGPIETDAEGNRIVGQWTEKQRKTLDVSTERYQRAKAEAGKAEVDVGDVGMSWDEVLAIHPSQVGDWRSGFGRNHSIVLGRPDGTGDGVFYITTPDAQAGAELTNRGVTATNMDGRSGFHGVTISTRPSVGAKRVVVRLRDAVALDAEGNTMLRNGVIGASGPDVNRTLADVEKEIRDMVSRMVEGLHAGEGPGGVVDMSRPDIQDEIEVQVAKLKTEALRADVTHSAGGGATGLKGEIGTRDAVYHTASDGHIEMTVFDPENVKILGDNAPLAARESGYYPFYAGPQAMEWERGVVHGDESQILLRTPYLQGKIERQLRGLTLEEANAKLREILVAIHPDATDAELAALPDIVMHVNPLEADNAYINNLVEAVGSRWMGKVAARADRLNQLAPFMFPSGTKSQQFQWDVSEGWMRVLTKLDKGLAADILRAKKRTDAYLNTEHQVADRLANHFNEWAAMLDNSLEEGTPLPGREFTALLQYGEGVHDAQATIDEGLRVAHERLSAIGDERANIELARAEHNAEIARREAIPEAPMDPKVEAAVAAHENKAVDPFAQEQAQAKAEAEAAKAKARAEAPPLKPEEAKANLDAEVAKLEETQARYDAMKSRIEAKAEPTEKELDRLANMEEALRAQQERTAQAGHEVRRAGVPEPAQPPMVVGQQVEGGVQVDASAIPADSGPVHITDASKLPGIAKDGLSGGHFAEPEYAAERVAGWGDIHDPVVIRTKSALVDTGRADIKGGERRMFRTEGTVPADQLEVLGKDGKWHPLPEAKTTDGVLEMKQKAAAKAEAAPTQAEIDQAAKVLRSTRARADKLGKAADAYSAKLDAKGDRVSLEEIDKLQKLEEQAAEADRIAAEADLKHSKLYNWKPERPADARNAASSPLAKADRELATAKAKAEKAQKAFDEFDTHLTDRGAYDDMETTGTVKTTAAENKKFDKLQAEVERTQKAYEEADRVRMEAFHAEQGKGQRPMGAKPAPKPEPLVGKTFTTVPQKDPKYHMPDTMAAEELVGADDPAVQYLGEDGKTIFNQKDHGGSKEAFRADLLKNGQKEKVRLLYDPATGEYIIGDGYHRVEALLGTGQPVEIEWVPDPEFVADARWNRAQEGMPELPRVEPAQKVPANPHEEAVAKAKQQVEAEAQRAAAREEAMRPLGDRAREAAAKAVPMSEEEQKAADKLLAQQAAHEKKVAAAAAAEAKAAKAEAAKRPVVRGGGTAVGQPGWKGYSEGQPIEAGSEVFIKSKTAAKAKRIEVVGETTKNGKPGIAYKTVGKKAGAEGFMPYESIIDARPAIKPPAGPEAVALPQSDAEALLKAGQEGTPAPKPAKPAVAPAEIETPTVSTEGYHILAENPDGTVSVGETYADGTQGIFAQFPNMDTAEAEVSRLNGVAPEVKQAEAAKDASNAAKELAPEFNQAADEDVIRPQQLPNMVGEDGKPMTLPGVYLRDANGNPIPREEIQWYRRSELEASGAASPRADDSVHYDSNWRDPSNAESYRAYVDRNNAYPHPVEAKISEITGEPVFTDGNHTFQIAKDRGEEWIPVRVVKAKDTLTEAERAAVTRGEEAGATAAEQAAGRDALFEDMARREAAAVEGKPEEVVFAGGHLHDFAPRYSTPEEVANQMFEAKLAEGQIVRGTNTKGSIFTGKGELVKKGGGRTLRPLEAITQEEAVINDHIAELDRARSAIENGTFYKAPEEAQVGARAPGVHRTPTQRGQFAAQQLGMKIGKVSKAHTAAEKEVAQVAERLGRLRAQLSTAMSTLNKTYAEAKGIRANFSIALRKAEPTNLVGETLLRVPGLEGYAMPEYMAAEFHAVVDHHGPGALTSEWRKWVLGPWKRWATYRWPGFHVRNFFGAWFNNFLGNVGVRDYEFAWRVNNFGKRDWSNTVVDAKHFYRYHLNDLFGPDTVGSLKYGDVQEFLATRLNIGSANTRSVLESADNIESMRSIVDDISNKRLSGVHKAVHEIDGKMRDLGAGVEDYHRVAAWGQGMLQTGGDPWGARSFVMLRHGDYADLTPAEDHIRDIIPFYKWMRTNTPYQIRMLAENPAKVTFIASKVKRSAYDVAGVDQTQAELNQPDYMKQTMAIPIPKWVPFIGSKGPDAIKYAMFDLPYNDLYNGLNDYASAALPYVRNIMESYVYHTQSFTGKPLTGRMNRLSGAFGNPVIGELLSKVPLLGVKKGEDGSFYIQDRMENILTAIPIYSRFRNFIEADPARVEARMGGVFSSIAGIGLRADNATQAELDFYYNELEPILQQYRDMGVTFPNAQDFVDAGSALAPKLPSYPTATPTAA